MRMLYTHTHTHTLVLFVAISHPLAGADPVPAMAAVDPAHEPSGKADHAQVHHHEQQDERDRDEEELLALAPRQRSRHGRRF